VIKAFLKWTSFGYRSRGLSDGTKTRSYPNGDAANSQPDRGCNANGAGVVEAKQDGPMVNSAKKQQRATEGCTGHFLTLPVVLSGGVPELDFLIGLLKFFGYHIETR
jgi:hypothetical protein